MGAGYQSCDENESEFYPERMIHFRSLTFLTKRELGYGQTITWHESHHFRLK